MFSVEVFLDHVGIYPTREQAEGIAKALSAADPDTLYEVWDDIAPLSGWENGIPAKGLDY